MRIVHGFLAVISTLCLGCAVAAQQAAAPAVNTVASVKQIMEAMVEPGSDAVFKAAADAPTDADDNAWAAIRNAAVTVSESGNLLMLGDRVKDRTDWMKMSRAMVDAGARALKAATDKNADALSAAGDEIYNTCETCHAKYLTQR
jgi:cytochrome c556